MNIILGVILWSLKKFSRNDRGKMFTARPRRTRTYGGGDNSWQSWEWTGTPGIVLNRHQHSGNILKSTYDAPDDEGKFKVMREAEDGQTEEGEHTCLWRENLKNSKLIVKWKQRGNWEEKREFTDHTWRPLCAVSAAWGSGWQETSCDGCSETSQFPQTGWTLFLEVER